MVVLLEQLHEEDQLEKPSNLSSGSKDAKKSAVYVMVTYAKILALRQTYQVWPGGDVKCLNQTLTTELASTEDWREAASRILRDNVLLWARLAVDGYEVVAKRKKQAMRGGARKAMGDDDDNEEEGVLNGAELEALREGMLSEASDLLLEDTLLKHVSVVSVEEAQKGSEDEAEDDDDDEDDEGNRAVLKKKKKATTSNVTYWVQADFSALPPELQAVLGLPGGTPFFTTRAVGLSHR